MNTEDVWPGGRTWIFQGTVAEDATAGTHVCSLTVTPGAGNEMEVLYGSIKVGNTATAQISSAFITDGTNTLGFLTGSSGTTANLVYSFPYASATSTNSLGAGTRLLVSGTMTLTLTVTTAAVSVTQTFAVVCRIKGKAPLVSLNDTIGTSTNTVNTSVVF